MFVLFAVNCAAEGTCGMDRDLSTINHMLLSLLNDNLREMITHCVLVRSLHPCGHCQLCGGCCVEEEEEDSLTKSNKLNESFSIVLLLLLMLTKLQYSSSFTYRKDVLFLMVNSVVFPFPCSSTPPPKMNYGTGHWRGMANKWLCRSGVDRKELVIIS